MRVLLVALAALLTAGSMQGGEVAVAWSPDAKVVIVADGNMRTVVFQNPQGRVMSQIEGVRHPRTILAEGSTFAVLDPIDNQVVLGDAATGTGRIIHLSGSPTAGALEGGALLVVIRDRGQLVRMRGAEDKSVLTDSDPSFLRISNGLTYVYSRMRGSFVEYDSSTLLERRRIALPQFASTMIVHGFKAYLTYPGTGELRTVNLPTLTLLPVTRIGSTPTDIAVAARSPISTVTLAVADPASKRIWRTDGDQSLSEAVIRGFLRGFISLGLSAPASSDFPTGIDRVWIAGKRLLALDSSEGVLYDSGGSKARRIGDGVDASGVAALPDGRVFFWSGKANRLVTLPE